MDAVLLDTCVLPQVVPVRHPAVDRRGRRLPAAVVRARPRGTPAQPGQGRGETGGRRAPPDPDGSLLPLGITVAGQDDFLSGLLELYPEAVLDALRRQASRYRREPRTVMALLNVLTSPGQGCPEFARQCRTLL
jgi:hypothetical protein